MACNLLIKRVYWGYNTLILTFDPNFQRDIKVGWWNLTPFDRPSLHPGSRSPLCCTERKHLEGAVTALHTLGQLASLQVCEAAEHFESAFPWGHYFCWPLASSLDETAIPRGCRQSTSAGMGWRIVDLFPISTRWHFGLSSSAWLGSHLLYLYPEPPMKKWPVLMIAFPARRYP